MMHSQTLSHDSPLYGRHTAQLNMGSIPFDHYHEFYEKVTDRQLVERYAVTGGVPKYVELFPARRDVLRAIEDAMLDLSGFLYAEPEFLLSREVGEVGTCFSILRAMAARNQRPGAIAFVLGVSQTSLSKYLGVLIELGLMRRDVPATEKNPAKSKRGRYCVADNFMRFRQGGVAVFRPPLAMSPAPLQLRRGCSHLPSAAARRVRAGLRKARRGGVRCG